MRVGALATHPIQYQAPLWRRLAALPGLDLKVFYFSDENLKPTHSPEFGQRIEWDVPLLEGYASEIVARDGRPDRPASMRLPDPNAFFREQAFDWVLLHGYTHRFAQQALRNKDRGGFKVALRAEFADAGQRRGWARQLVRAAYLKWFYARVDAFCYIGAEARRHLQARGIPAERQFFSPYCIDDELLERQKADLDRGAARRELGIAPDQVAFLFSGKFIERKDPLLLVEAAARVPGNERLVLVMLGSGPLFESVAERGKALLGNRLLLPGFVNQSHLGKYFAAADVFVLPSRFETWGLVVNEAMQYGLPAIVSANVLCRHDLVVEGETGACFPAGDAGALGACMARYLNDGEARRREGTAAAERIKEYSSAAAAAGIARALGWKRP